MNKNNKLTPIEYFVSINRYYINKPIGAQLARGANEWEKKTLSSLNFQRSIKKGYAFAPQFTTSRVVKSNFAYSNYIALDIDNNMRLEEALSNPLITQNCDFIYTTASHTSEHHKFRILFVTAQGWDSIELYEAAIKRLMAKVGCVDESTKNANRIFFGSNAATFYKFNNRISPSLLEELNAPLPSQILKPSQKIYLRDNIALKNAMFMIPGDLKEARDDLVRLALFAEVNIAPGVGQDLYIEKWHNGANTRSDIKGAMRKWYEAHDAIVSLSRIKKILHKFGVDYTYSLFPMDFERFSIKERFLSVKSIEKSLQKKKLIAIKSPMGTGKTTFLRKYLEDKEFDFVAHRISLVNKLASDFNAVSYRDSNYYLNTLEQEITRFVCTFHSYARSKTTSKPVMVIDEVHQGLHTLATEDLLIGKRRPTFKFLSEQFEKAQQILILDAHLMDEDVAAIAEMGKIDPKDILIIENNFKLDRGTCYFYETKTPMSLIETLKESLEKGNRCYLSCVSRKTAKTTEILLNESFEITEENILNQLDTEKYKILMINAETSKNPEVVRFLQDPSEQAKLYDLVIATPTIGSGVSFDGPLFDKVFHIGAGDVIPLTDQLQMPSRVRDCRERHMWVEARKPRSKLTDDCLIYNLIVENAIQTGSLNLIEENGVKKLNDTDALIAKIRSYHKAKNTVHQYNARDKAKEYLIEDGWELGVIATDTTKSKPLFDKIKKHLNLRNLEEIYNARDLDSYDAVEFETLTVTDPEDMFALLKFKIKDALRVDKLTPDLVQTYLKRRYQECIKFIESCTLDLDNLSALDQAELQLSEVDKTFYLFRKKLLNDIFKTVGRDIESILESPLEYNEMKLEAFSAFVMKNSAVITQTLKLEVAYGFSPNELFGRILDKMGIRKRARSMRLGERVFKTYTSNPYEIYEIIKRRRTIPSSFDALMQKINAPIMNHPLLNLDSHGRFKKTQKNL